MRLPEAGLFGQSQPRQFAFPDPVKKCLAEIFLEASEFHESSIARSYTPATNICKRDLRTSVGLFHNENPRSTMRRAGGSLSTATAAM
jgi:hypothetical protein